MTKKLCLYTALAFAACLNLQLAGLRLWYLPELLLLLTGACLLAMLRERFGRRWLRAAAFLLCRGEAGALLWGAALAYLAVDLAGGFAAFSLAPAWEKYRVTAALLTAALALSACREEPRFLRGCAAAAALSGALIAGGALVNTFLLNFQPVEYIRRLSLRSDYNLFASALLFAFLASAFAAMQSGRPLLLFAASCVGMLPVVILAASRRIWLLLPPVLLVTAGALLAALFRKNGKKALRRAAAALAGIACAVWLCTAGLSFAMAELGKAGTPAGLSEAGGAASVSERFETIAASTVFTKRLVLWSIAVEELRGFTPVELLFGRGAFYDLTLYNEERFAARLDGIYPEPGARAGKLSAHSCVLADLLNGGLLKLSALLFLIGVTFLFCLRLLLAKPLFGLPLALILGVTLLNNLVSNRYGLLYDRWFWLPLALTAALSTRREDASCRRPLRW